MKDGRESAETFALNVLSWLVAEEDLLPAFLASSGLQPSELRGRAADPDVLAAVLDFLLMDDAWVRRFCDQAGLPCDAPMRARAGLPGGEQTHWT